MPGDAYWIASGYSKPGEDDIAMLRLSPQGILTKVAGLCQGESPSFLALKGDRLYAGCEGAKSAKVIAYQVAEDGFRQAGSFEAQGGGLCHLTLVPGLVMGSCYGTGDFFALDEDLGREVWRYTPPEDGIPHHAHCAAYHREALYGVDLGGESILRFAREGEGFSSVPTVTELPKGTGPRQMIFCGEGEGYLMTEQANTVWPFWLEGERLRLGTPVPCSAKEEPKGYPASACLSQTGTLAVPVRGADCLSIFQEQGGKLDRAAVFACDGRWPRFAAWAEQERFLLVCSQRDHRVTCYRYEKECLLPVSFMDMPGASCCVLWQSQGKDGRDHEKNTTVEARLGDQRV